VAELRDHLQTTLNERYRVERELGHGGMATVYLALDLRLQRRVALKVLRPELTASLGADRFLREIEIVARLSHPHILQLHDSGEAGGRLFYAMPYVEGESLRQRLDREGQLPVAHVIAIARAVASALTYAHQQGIIHRDIKPENILLAKDSAGGHAHPLVADFGIARALDAAGGERLTETGLALGTPAYMSPEQAAGGQSDGRADIYALGCVAYEMLAGSPPFTGATAQAIMARHAVDPVLPLHTVRATIPAAVEAAIEQALAKVPADRFATADEFARALTAEHIPRRHLRQRSPLRRTKLILALVGGSVTAGLGAMMLGRSPAPVVIPSAASIAVLPFVSGGADTTMSRLGRDLAVTISASLEGVGAIKTADRLSIATATADKKSLSIEDGAALARRLGASSMLRGTLVRAGNNVRLDMGLYGTDGLAPVAQGITVTAYQDSIGALTDSATWALLRQVWQRGEPPSPSLAAVTTRSLPALRAFLEGERELSDNRWDEAAVAYSSAIAADSTFWLAYFRYALTDFWLGEGVELNLTPLRLHLDDLPERERLLIAPMLDSMPLGSRIERFKVVTQRFPDYWPGWFLYADILHHMGPIVGYDWSEALAAFRRVAELNPKLIPAWEHLLTLTRGRDQGEASRASARLIELGWTGHKGQLFRLMDGIIQVEGLITPDLDKLADSLAESMRSSPATEILRHGLLVLLYEGFPAAQLELNRRARGSNDPKVRTALRAANAWAWAARGRWDSAVTLMGEVAAEHPGVIGRLRFSPPVFPPIGGPVLAIESYGLAVLGAWLGATAPALADQRRAAAIAAMGTLSDEESKRDGRGRVAWFDGILGFARGDRRAIQTARREAVRSGYYQAELVDRSLAAFERALAGDRKRAGLELAAIEEHCANTNHSHSFLDETNSCNLFTPHIAVQRLAAAQWLQEAGEVEQASRLLRWLDAIAWGGWLWTLNEALAGPTYLARARLAEAQGEGSKARGYYQQFLQRYDAPVPSQAHLVEEARTALARLETDR
jgi:tRNA A-37 threonylcarbamoyl transferase component Bud32/tetratricopeptide (TPR) repeat protein/TolB-like protein